MLGVNKFPFAVKVVKIDLLGYGLKFQNEPFPPYTAHASQECVVIFIIELLIYQLFDFGFFMSFQYMFFLFQFNYDTWEWKQIKYHEEDAVVRSVFGSC